ncbi:cysteine--tRNA ligase [Candidatus Woesearchaeota archaeon]|jgi:cysteinyl-tRNA synthetase|nr:cysteine--tRNA ligase [Candidatus Woesearchaeota archaeon]MBT4368879.1 cysteine--tRNA ligase [Candidatus Woesearchaeota archaeon]MBT4712168.1 cysteine--tRNA ligase [Candidatus Woesearchaeota archaeon]MBT6639084.1 cysteine--tRNA ligase [Candidatus Woesearchaeota archaeon]MBT7134284.1 cysteine--tRNA ligase [Candidatus Woesearchaeota archaeon]
MLKFYNTLTRKIEEFKPIKKDEVSLYSCGPTVYNYVHIGNLRAYIFNDILRRYLKYKGFKLKQVMNITDVDDKTIRDSQKEGKSLKEFTEFYTEAFLSDLTKLNIEIPGILPRATEHIEGMVELVKKLLEKGYAYKTENGDIYYKISKFTNYGKLACLQTDDLKQNADGRLSNKDEYGKEDARDFALWKAYDKEDGEVYWETEIGKGRPGWHIECSVMSVKYLGQPFDIHTGGVDLIFPHHTNEIAQSEAAKGKKLANYWMHNEHLIVNGEKMSKSLGNFYTLQDLIKKGYDPLSIRYELMSTHYRQKMDFREDQLKNIPSTLRKFHDFLDKLDEIESKEYNKTVTELISEAKENFEKAMDNDLNISGGLASIFNFMTEINKIEIGVENATEIKEFMDKIDSVLGIMEHTNEEVPKEITELANKREEARKNKNWEEADRLRDEIKDKGYVLEDSDKGVRVKKV